MSPKSDGFSISGRGETIHQAERNADWAERAKTEEPARAAWSGWVPLCKLAKS